MKIYLVNGSPRKNQNTARMCESFADGAKSKGVDAEIINLYDINFKGCYSCFACKLKDGKNFGRCSYPDDLTPILDKISAADGLVLATPVYFGNAAGVMRCFAERLLFPFFEYKQGYPSIAPQKMPTAVIYTMNVPLDTCEQMYPGMMKNFEWSIGAVFSTPDRILACDTYQFNDYSKYVSECFDAEHKTRQRAEQFPKDLQNAYEHGVMMAEKIISE